MKSLLLALGLFALPGLARAEKVKLDIKVVQVSNQGKETDPRLKHMERDFQKQSFSFSSYKLVSEQQPTLEMKSTATVSLPDGKTAQLTPTGTSAGPKGKLINMHVTVPAIGMDLNYSVGNNGTNFLGAGPAGHGSPPGSQIFLVVTHSLK